MKNGRIFSLKFVGIVKCVNLWISWWHLFGLFLRCHLQDSGRGFQALSDVQHAVHAQWTVQLLASNSWCGQWSLTGYNKPHCDVTAGHYYSQLMTTANTSCCWPAAARFTEYGQLDIVMCYTDLLTCLRDTPLFCNSNCTSISVIWRSATNTDSSFQALMFLTLYTATTCNSFTSPYFLTLPHISFPTSLPLLIIFHLHFSMNFR